MSNVIFPPSVEQIICKTPPLQIRLVFLAMFEMYLVARLLMYPKLLSRKKKITQQTHIEFEEILREELDSLATYLHVSLLNLVERDERRIMNDHQRKVEILVISFSCVFVTPLMLGNMDGYYTVFLYSHMIFIRTMLRLKIFTFLYLFCFYCFI